MTVWIVRDRKYWTMLEICANKYAAQQYIREHGREDEWIYQEKIVREETPDDVKTVY